VCVCCCCVCVRVFARAHRYGDAHRTWGKCAQCLGRNFGVVLDSDGAFYCFTCFGKRYSLAPNPHYLEQTQV